MDDDAILTMSDVREAVLFVIIFLILQTIMFHFLGIHIVWD